MPQSSKFGGSLDRELANGEPRGIYDGKIHIVLPPQCTLVFQHML